MTNKKLISIALACGFAASVLISLTGFKKSCDEMYNGIIRIRILANSDSVADQELKIAVRDAILEKSCSAFLGTENYADALRITSEKLPEIEKIAEEVISESGYDYDVSVKLRDEHFDTRVYDDFTLPAGVYKTAVIYIGEAKGKNWWCVIFPQVCVGSCVASLEDTISKQSADIAYNPERYEIRFKTVEIFENIKKYLDF